MTRVGARWHALRAKILQIRHGPGAAVIPSNVTRIHMEFAKTISEGHAGPRKFWREMLPRLKYHNPAIPMIVNRKPTNEGAAIMSVYFNTGSAPIDPATLPQPPSSAVDHSKAPAPIDGERVVKFDMKGKRSEEILERFIAETASLAVEPTPEELSEVEEVEKLRAKSEKDREAVAKIREVAKKEKAMLDRARAVVGP